MPERVAAFDWARSPLGPLVGWPPALRVAVDICLHTPSPMFVWWGPALVHLYNDAYAPILGARHPSALGRPARAVWPEVWDALGPQVEAVLERHESRREERMPLTLQRNGYPEPVCLSWTLTPIADAGGGTGGVLGIVTDETDRVRREEALAESQRRFEAALFAGEVGTFEWDVAADRLWGDANFARIFGIAARGGPLADYLAAIHPDDRDLVARHIRRTVDTGADYHVEYRIVHTGTIRSVVARGRTERSPEAEVVRFAGVLLDVTERKRTEQALRSSEARYRALFHSIDEGFGIVQLLFDAAGRAVDFRWTEANPAWAKQTGIEDAIGRTPGELGIELEDTWFRTLARIARTGVPVRLEIRAEALDRWFDVFAFRVEEKANDQVAILLTDVSDAKRAEQALHESRERFRAVLESALDAAYRRDLRTDTYDYLSPRIEQVLGIAAETMRSLPVDRLLQRMHPDDRGGVHEAIEHAMRAHRGRVEYRFLGDDGEYRWVADHFTVQLDEHGTPIRRTGIVRDITEQKLGEERLREAKELAEQASRAKSQFLAVMSHELRTPLTGVIGFADLLETGVLGELRPEQREALARIQASSWHLVAIIDEILTLSRVDAGKEEVRLDETDLRDICREVVHIIEPQARARGLALVRTGTGAPVRIRTDVGKVRQILTNLVGNAVKYTVEGSITVELHADGGAGGARVVVADTGPGIAPEDRERIFEPFTQIDSSHTRGAAGIGLGLAICRRMARLLGGEVTVESQAGAGSRFTLHLPGADRE